MVICIGCQEMKPESEMKDFDGELLCLKCRNAEYISLEFCKLEEQEAKLTDEIIELESDYEYARQRMLDKEKFVQTARKKYQENARKMVNFDWNRKVITE